MKPTDAATPADDFHAHLDVCKRCADEPFNLCPVGANLLQRAAEATATPTAK